MAVNIGASNGACGCGTNTSPRTTAENGLVPHWLHSWRSPGVWVFPLHAPLRLASSHCPQKSSSLDSSRRTHLQPAPHL